MGIIYICRSLFVLTFDFNLKHYIYVRQCSNALERSLFISQVLVQFSKLSETFTSFFRMQGMQHPYHFSCNTSLTTLQDPNRRETDKFPLNMLLLQLLRRTTYSTSEVRFHFRIMYMEHRRM